MQIIIKFPFFLCIFHTSAVHFLFKGAITTPALTMKILPITVLLCVVFQHTNSTNNDAELNMFELYKEANARQETYKKEWEKLINMKDGIEKTTYLHKDGVKTGVFYKLTGTEVKKYKLTEIFYMLQNWALLSPDNNRVQFELPIGGENFKFHLQRDKNNQILVFGDNKLVEYKDLYRDISTHGYDEKEIAKLMLDSSRETAGGQTKWDVKIDAKTAEDMRTLMIIGQVAEAARP